MTRWVDISFDCLPLRSVVRIDIPLDASPRYRDRCLRIKEAMAKHGTHNTYYLYNAKCVFHLTNRDDHGMIEFSFEGTIFTDGADERAERCELQVTLTRETCDWLIEPVVNWFHESVRHAVTAEFDRYIEAGDLQRTKDRLAKLQASTDETGGFVGMYL